LIGLCTETTQRDRAVPPSESAEVRICPVARRPIFRAPLPMFSPAESGSGCLTLRCLRDDLGLDLRTLDVDLGGLTICSWPRHGGLRRPRLRVRSASWLACSYQLAMRVLGHYGRLRNALWHLVAASHNRPVAGSMFPATGSAPAAPTQRGGGGGQRPLRFVMSAHGGPSGSGDPPTEGRPWAMNA
jgi:hypothetical protein